MFWPAEFHLLLGAVNTLYKHMKQEFEDISMIWVKHMKYSHGGKWAFDGNACVKLLQKVD